MNLEEALALIEEQKKTIEEQKLTIERLEADLTSLLENYNNCWACALSEDGQMCYDCFYGPDHD